MKESRCQIGDKACLEREITENDILEFARITGDNNPIHVDKETAAKGQFGEPIAHGFLVGATISTVIGMKLPGPGTIYLEQNLRFVCPVKIGDVIRTEVTVTDALNAEKGIYKLATNVYNQNHDAVIEGYAVVKKQ